MTDHGLKQAASRPRGQSHVPPGQEGQPGRSRRSLLVRIFSLAMFLAASAATWYAVFFYHAADDIHITLIIVLMIAAGAFLYRAAEGDTRLLLLIGSVLPLALVVSNLEGTATSHPGEILVQKWAPCPASTEPLGSHPAANPDPVETSTPRWYGSAHIDSVIAPDGSAHITDKELACMTTMTSPSPARTLWLMLRIEPKPAPPLRNYKLYFAVGPISNPRAARSALQVMRNCSSPTPGVAHVHMLMVVSVNEQQNRELWNDYNHNLASNCAASRAYDYHRHKRIGVIVSNQTDVLYK
jgi:hypothetical protein